MPFRGLTVHLPAGVYRKRLPVAMMLYKYLALLSILSFKFCTETRRSRRCRGWCTAVTVTAFDSLALSASPVCELIIFLLDDKLKTHQTHY